MNMCEIPVVVRAAGKGKRKRKRMRKGEVILASLSEKLLEGFRIVEEAGLVEGMAGPSVVRNTKCFPTLVPGSLLFLFTVFSRAALVHRLASVCIKIATHWSGGLVPVESLVQRPSFGGVL